MLNKSVKVNVQNDRSMWSAIKRYNRQYQNPLYKVVSESVFYTYADNSEVCRILNAVLDTAEEKTGNPYYRGSGIVLAMLISDCSDWLIATIDNFLSLFD